MILTTNSPPDMTVSSGNSSSDSCSSCASAIDSTLDQVLPGCAGGESFALMVLGHSMVPEFLEGEIIIVEPDGLAKDGSYVLAWYQGEWTFRQLLGETESWVLHPLNPAFADARIANLATVRGVIIQKAIPGQRRSSKRYI